MLGYHVVVTFCRTARENEGNKTVLSQGAVYLAKGANYQHLATATGYVTYAYARITALYMSDICLLDGI